MGCLIREWTQFIQTFVLQEAVEAGCVTEMLGVQDIQHPFVLTVTFVEFLVLTSVVWEPWEEKQELQLVDVHGQAGYSGEAYGIGIMGGTGVNIAWCPVDVHSMVLGGGQPLDRVHSVETGP